MSVADDSLIPDDLLRQIIGVGQVDLLVGLPTLDHGDAMPDAVRAVRSCFRTHFPRLRTALLNVDRGSSDGTQEALYHSWGDGAASAAGSDGLRTTHYMTASAATWADGDLATRCVLAAGDLLQATAVVVLDADVDGLTPSWIAALAASVRDRQVDLVAPVYRRHAADGLLVTQLVRPLMRAVYGQHLREPLLAEFGCSGRFAARCTHLAWQATSVRRATHVWIAGEALSGGFAVRQADLGPRRLRAGRQRAPLSEVFRQVVGSAFSTIEAHAGYWRAVNGTTEPDRIGPSPEWPAAAETPVHDGAHLLASFAADVSTIDEILRRILSPGTLAAVSAGSREAPPRFTAEVWAATVAEFLVAYHRGVMHRDHIAQALLPLYTARTGAFLVEHGDDSAEALEAAGEDVCRAFEQARTVIMERWLLPA